MEDRPTDLDTQLVADVAGNQIHLQVGERRYVTTKDTLLESSFLSAYASGRWKAQPDGSYFVDADGDLFEHILRYLRRGVLPIFFELSEGHNYVLYLNLLEEARYFQIDRLVKWIEDKGYLEALTIDYRPSEVEGVASLGQRVASDTVVDFSSSWGIEKIYVCPRGIVVHRGSPTRCGQACHRARGGADIEYDEVPLVRTLVMKKTVILDGGACLQGR